MEKTEAEESTGWAESLSAGPLRAKGEGRGGGGGRFYAACISIIPGWDAPALNIIFTSDFFAGVSVF